MNDTIKLTFLGVKGSSVSPQDVEDSFSARLAAYGGTLVSTVHWTGGMTITLSLPDSKTFANFKTFVAGIAADLGGEFTIVTGSNTDVNFSV